MRLATRVYLIVDLLNLCIFTIVDCPKPVNVPVVVGSLISILVAVGIALLLLWKCLTTIHDQREFEKFKKDIAYSKWGKVYMASFQVLIIYIM